MDLKNIIAVSGLPGLYRMKTNRSNGLIIEELQSGKTKFASARKHQFTPLESIGLFTIEDTIDISDVFKSMKGQEHIIEIPKSNASDQIVKTYFAELIPNYDKDRVFVKDMKKVIKWYRFLKDAEVFQFEDEEE